MPTSQSEMLDSATNSDCMAILCVYVWQCNKNTHEQFIIDNNLSI